MNTGISEEIPYYLKNYYRKEIKTFLKKEKDNSHSNLEFRTKTKKRKRFSVDRYETMQYNKTMSCYKMKKLHNCKIKLVYYRVITLRLQLKKI